MADQHSAPSIVDSVAQAIRIGDGSHSMGAAATAELVLAHLRSLPVEQRMEAMGMTLYGEVTWDDEAEADTVKPEVDVTPGAALYVEATWVGLDD